MKEASIQDLEDARGLIHGQGIDLIFALGMWTVFSKAQIARFPELLDGHQVPAARLFLSHILLTLCKAAEVYRKYKYLLADDCRKDLKEIAIEVERRRIDEFRNKVIGHIWDKDLKRPLSPEVVDRRVEEIVGDIHGFCSWIMNMADANDPETVVGKLSSSRRALQREIKRRKAA